MALFWGLLSAIAFVFFTVSPQKLYQNYSILSINGWAFFNAGISLILGTRSYLEPIEYSFPAIGLTLAITIVGTLIPFLIYGIGVQILGNVKASLFVTVEPIFSAIMAFLFLKVSFTKIDIVGLFCIIGAIWLAALKSLKQS